MREPGVFVTVASAHALLRTRVPGTGRGPVLACSAMQTTRFLLLCLVLLCAAAVPALAQTTTTTLRHFAVELGVIDYAVSGVQTLRVEAAEAGQRSRLRCIEDRAIYLRGLELAVRTGIDEYAVARAAGDVAGMQRSATRITRAAERAPGYLTEAEACTERLGAQLRDECSTEPGEACTRWTVRVDFDHEYDEWGGFGASTVPPAVASTR